MTRIEQSIEVNVPVSTAYRQLTRFEQYPRFMEDVEEVRQVDDTHLHWHTRAGNLDLEWDAEITEQVPDRCIAWRNLNGPRYEGKIELRPTESDRTEVRLTMECDPKQQVLAQHGDAQKAINDRTEHDLARFKKFIEKLGKESHDWLGKIKDTEPLTTDAGAAAMPDSRSSDGGRGDGRTASNTSNALSGATPMTWMPSLMQAWTDPLDFMRRVTSDMDRIVERMTSVATVGTPAVPNGFAHSWAPPLEVAQREGAFVVCAELAGVRREDVQVQIEGDRLTIEGERKQVPPQGPQEYRRSERAYGRFYRTVGLPPGADVASASASLHDGVLEITVPLPQQSGHRRRIEIRTGR